MKLIESIGKILWGFPAAFITKLFIENVDKGVMGRYEFMSLWFITSILFILAFNDDG